MKLRNLLPFLAVAALTVTACKKKGCTDAEANNYNESAKKDDGTCTYDTDEDIKVPNTYSFTDENGNNTVSYGGQTDRLNQLGEMTTYMKSGTAAELDVTVLNAMFANEGDNGGGNFSFSSSKQLKNKCLTIDVPLFEGYLAELADASVSFGIEAEAGVAGTLSSGSSTYLFASNGIEYTQLIEKGLMGAVFLNQATNTYFGDGKMNVDNSTAVAPADGKYYTEMEHHWDEAFGYFGAPEDFPTNTTGLRFWAKYCNSQDANLGCNAKLMNAFLKGRAVINQKADLSIRNEQITIIRKEWERVSASQAVTYLEGAKANFGTDNAKYLHELSEAYAFILNLKYAPLETRVIDFATINNLLEDVIGDNFWAVTIVDLNTAINTLNDTYNF